MASTRKDNSFDGLGGVVVRLAEQLGTERARLTAAEQRVDGLERELAAALRRGIAREREVAMLLDLLVQQEERTVRPAAPAPGKTARLLERFRPSTSPAAPASGEARPEKGKILAVAVGMQRAELTVMALTARAHAERAEAEPVFITDSLDAVAVARRGARIEYLPPAEDVAALMDRDAWRWYVTQRLAILALKWRPVAIVAYGAAAQAWLDEIRSVVPRPDALAGLLSNDPAGA